MTGRVFGAMVLAVLVVGASAAQASLAPPIYNTDTDHSLDVQWVWTLENENLTPSFTAAHWSIDLVLSFDTPDDQTGSGSALATLQHPDDFGSGVGGSATLSITFGVENGIFMSDPPEDGFASHGTVQDSYTLSLSPGASPFVAILRITGAHPGAGPPVPAPSAAILVAIGLGIVRRSRRRRAA